MSEQYPNHETVFQDAYWPQPKPLPPSGEWVKPRLTARYSAYALIGEAAQAIFKADYRKPLSSGTELDYDPSNPCTQPGKVLLLDIERLEPSKPVERMASVMPAPRHLQRHMSEADVTVPAATLFKSNAVPHRQLSDDAHTVYPYDKYLLNPETKQKYSRIVRLFSFTHAKDGSVVGYSDADWTMFDDFEIEGNPNEWDTERRIPFQPGVVGQTYFLDGVAGYTRIRSAEDCLVSLGNYRSAPRIPAESSFFSKLIGAISPSAVPSH